MKQRIRIHKAEPNTGVLNYSHLLDAPAGKHGFVEAKKGHLYFEDGTRARFLGFNVAARSNTPDHETADRMAERFASMGVNIIRLHAADAPVGEEPGSWSSCKEAPLLDYASGTSRKFNPDGLDRFDYFAAKLKEKGIYLHIDLIVARKFEEGDGMEYPGGAPSCIKRYCLYNQRMIELQKEYAKELLCHVNPYTGLALIDDPAVVTIQINNEDTAIKGNMGDDAGEEMKSYRAEVQERFNDFLLMKYHTREHLEEAWTKDGCCALGEEEDPARGTVRGIEGSFYQPVSDPEGEWDAPEGPARYADFMEFGIYMNRKFYQDMKDYIHFLGAKVPVVTSNLIAGAADVYGHTDGDLMENNSYFNHPLLPVENNTYLVAGPMEYVSTNPLTMQTGAGSAATTLLSLGSLAIVKGKPFMLSEWNEYGEHPFHSTAFVQMAAYACLNDWDGLILYNHHTSENWDDQPADEILNVFDVYNDPAVICQWGFMASVFLKGLVSVAKNCVDVVYTQNDLKTLPLFHAILECLRHQFQDGHGVLTWYPYDDTRYSDQPFWIIWAVCELIKETGDLSILDTEIEWQDGGKASVLEHVKAAINRLILDKGEHGLVKIYFADWNDALNITDDPEAESVMLSHQFCLALRELKRMMEYAGDTQYAGFLEKEYEQLKEDINRYAWDGKWYARALSSKGNVGTQDSAGSKIYLNAQTWAVLAGVADRERLAYVLEAVDSMEQDFGFPLNLPPYPEYDAHVGRMSGMLPGLFENGGVYCHARGLE